MSLLQLLGARDYAGAAKVLGVIYHRFVVTPSLCIEVRAGLPDRYPIYTFLTKENDLTLRCPRNHVNRRALRSYAGGLTTVVTC